MKHTHNLVYCFECLNLKRQILAGASLKQSRLAFADLCLYTLAQVRSTQIYAETCSSICAISKVAIFDLKGFG